MLIFFNFFFRFVYFLIIDVRKRNLEGKINNVIYNVLEHG